MKLELLRRSETDASAVSRACAGLFLTPKHLPPWLFYDERGTQIFEEITRLPEYYPTRVEHGILRMHAEDIIAAAMPDTEPWAIIELGAGTATKTEALLQAAVERQQALAATTRDIGVDFFPADVAPQPLAIVAARLQRTLPQVHVHPVPGPHEAAFRQIKAIPARRLVLYIGSSIGNFDHTEAIEFLRQLRASLRPDDAFLLGTDLRKDIGILLPAYDDAAGVTARFNLNMLARLNREAGAHFDLHRFRHVARWNAELSRIEMHLESCVDQIVRIDALEASAVFRAGETIHTESSYKYDMATIDWLLTSAGFARSAVYTDAYDWFAVTLAHAV
jgi:dimethylhistidine N-methyltransferase